MTVFSAEGERVSTHGELGAILLFAQATPYWALIRTTWRLIIISMVFTVKLYTPLVISMVFTVKLYTPLVMKTS